MEHAEKQGDRDRFTIKWHNKLHVRFGLMQVLVLVLIVGATISVLFTVERALLLEEGYNLSEQLGRRLLSQLGERIVTAESLAAALANVGETLEKEEDLFRKIIPHLLNYEYHEGLIAGGGIWPEPNFFQEGVARRSFFWGRDDYGRLKYYDNYNDPAGPGYHQEEWYVPVRHVEPGTGYWSKSYMDPYSRQPMVTCSVPMHERGHFAGVATVDVRLEGLDALFRETALPTGGYIFALDRNHTFLSYPIPQKVRTGPNEESDEDQLINIGAFIEREPTYGPILDVLQKMTDEHVQRARALDVFDQALVGRLAEESYQIDEEAAHHIVAGLHPHDPLRQHGVHRLFWADDPILGGSVMASVFHMPRTHWNVVVVSPTARLYATADLVTRQVALYVVGLELVGLLILFFVLRGMIIKPLRRMAQDVVGLSAANDVEAELDTSRPNELGLLADVINHRTQMLSGQLVKRAEAERALKETEARFVSFMEFLPGPALMCDQDHCLVYRNPYYIKMFGQDGDRLESGFLQRDDNDPGPREDFSLSGNISAGGVVGMVVDKKVHHFLLQRFPVPREGKPALVGLLGMDISEQVEAEEALRRAHDGLEARVSERTADLRRINEELQAFVSIVSHDLRAPLTNISGFTSELEHCFGETRKLLVDKPLDAREQSMYDLLFGEDIPDALKYINASVKRMDRQIQAILGLARLGHRSLLPRRVDMDGLVRSILQSMEHQMNRCNGSAQVKDLPELVVDKDAVEQILSNLLDNAVKYLSPTRKGVIVVTAAWEQEVYRLDVRDNGRGIREQDLERIFQIFRRSGDEDVPGEGLGLAYVRTLLRRMGGHIVCRSVPGEGSTFTIRLPKIAPEPEEEWD